MYTGVKRFMKLTTDWRSNIKLRKRR